MILQCLMNKLKYIKKKIYTHLIPISCIQKDNYAHLYYLRNLDSITDVFESLLACIEVHKMLKAKWPCSDLTT